MKATERPDQFPSQDSDCDRVQAPQEGAVWLK